MAVVQDFQSMPFNAKGWGAGVPLLDTAQAGVPQEKKHFRNLLLIKEILHYEVLPIHQVGPCALANRLLHLSGPSVKFWEVILFLTRVTN